jgi:hypothetical protein
MRSISRMSPRTDTVFVWVQGRPSRMAETIEAVVHSLANILDMGMTGEFVCLPKHYVS